MSITIELNLPDALVREARATGLLESECMSDLLATELHRRKAAAELSNSLDQLRNQPGDALTEDEIQAEVNAVRAEKRARETGR